MYKNKVRQSHTTHQTTVLRQRPWQCRRASTSVLCSFFWIGRRCHINFSSHTMIYDIISYSYIQNMSTSVQYWWRYGWTSVGFETHHRSIKLRRAVASSILVRCRRFLHVNLDRYVKYILCNRWVSGRWMVHAEGVVAARCEISHTYVHNTITSSIRRIFDQFFHFTIVY